MFQAINRELALAFPASAILPGLLCTRVQGKVSLEKHSRTSVWQSKGHQSPVGTNELCSPALLRTDRTRKSPEWLMPVRRHGLEDMGGVMASEHGINVHTRRFLRKSTPRKHFLR